MINNMHFYEQLSVMPLFQGMSREDFMFVIGAVKFEFYTIQPGKTVIEEGSACESAVFLLDGEIKSVTNADDNSYSIYEYLSAPRELQVERVFGFNQHYDRRCIAVTKCSVVKISKNEILRIIDDSFVFRLNILNIFSTRIQRLGRIPWRITPSGIRAKIVRFVQDRCLYPAGMKVAEITMERLSQLIGESRLNTSDELKRMRSENLIDMKRGTIIIFALENMF